jgi:iron(III) transport system substrate-binding protein
VFFTENTPPLEFLQEHNLLAALTPSTLAAVDSKYNSTAGDWVGVSARVNMMVYNTDKLRPSELPKSLMDLASSAWKGKIGISPGETDFQPIVTSIIKDKGERAALAWLQGLKSNAGSHSYPDNESLTNMVNRGQVEIALINHYYWYRERDEVGANNLHSAIAFFAPKDAGYLLDVSGAAVLKSTKHAAAAQKLVAFLVGHNGEEILGRSESYEYPLGSGVVTAKPLKPFAQLQPIALSLSDLGDGSRAIALLQQVQLL